MPSALTATLKRAHWKFQATFLIVMKKIGFRPWEAFILSCKIRNVWDNSLMRTKKEYEQKIGQILAQTGWRLPLLSLWSYWASIRPLFNFNLESRSKIDREIKEFNLKTYNDIPALCASLVYLSANKYNLNLSQEKVWKTCGISSSRFRKTLNLLKKDWNKD